jgi:hypothetical protein
MPKYMTACLFALHIENVFQASTQMWGTKKGCIFPGFLRGKAPIFINDINFHKTKQYILRLVLVLGHFKSSFLTF